MHFCLPKYLILCFSTSQRSKNRLVYWDLVCICLGPMFSGLWWRMLLILDFTCLVSIKFTKVPQTFPHFSVKQKLFGLLQFETFLPWISVSGLLWRIWCMPDFTCLDEVLFAKVLAPLIVLLYVCVTDAQMDRFISYCVLYYTVLLRLCSE